MPYLVAITVLLPFALSLTMMLMLRRVRGTTAYYVTLIVSGATAMSALALLPHADHHAALSAHWKPGAGVMGLAPGATSVWAALVTSSALFVVLLSQIPDRSGFRVASGVLMLLTLATANVAFLADHFLARYVALEVVALCVALVLLVDTQQPTRFRPTWTTYLLLRVGDAGLLAAIFILLQGSGTLNIDKALEAGATLQPVPLAWAVLGFLLAVWVKLGGWPFHAWAQPGRGSSLTTQAWLYGTVMPNLGLYLLYRVTPLIHLAHPVQEVAFWAGAGGAAVAASMMLTEDDLRTAQVYLGAVQAGIAVLAAASGVKSAVWLSVALMTPLRVLIFLAADCAGNGFRRWQRRVASGLLTLGGLALLVYNLLITWWARQASAPLDALLVAEVGVAVCAIWVLRATRRLPAGRATGEQPSGEWLRWLVAGLVGIAVLAGAAKLGPLVGYLTTSGHVSALPVPAVSALLRHALTVPAVWAVLVLGWGFWQLQRRSGQEPFLLPRISLPVQGLEEELARAARTLHAVIEVGLLEQTLAIVVRVVRDGSQLIYRVVEQEGLDSLLVQVAQTVMSKASAAYRILEVEGPEAVQRRAVDGVMAVAKGLYRAVEGEGFEELQQRAAQALMGRVRTTYRVLEEEGIDELQRRAAQAVMSGARATYRTVEEEGSGGILRPIVRIAVGWGRGLQRWQTGRLRYNLMWVLGSLVIVVLVLAIVAW